MNEFGLIRNPDVSGPLILAVTGHRPDKLGGYGPQARNRLEDFAVGILAVRQPALVITGMAQGWDQAVAAACRTLCIPYHAAIPFRGQEKMWPAEGQNYWRGLLTDAVGQTIVCPGNYDPRKMQTRNEWMVDRCTKVLALWNGSSGGTSNCVAYARRIRGREVENVWDQLGRM